MTTFKTRWVAVKPIAITLFGLVVWVYSLSLDLYFVIRLAFGDRWTITAIFSSLIPLLLLPALVLFVIGLRLRKYRLALSLLPPIVVLLVFYGVRFLPVRGFAPAQGTPTLKILTYNLANPGAGPNGLVTVIRQSGADVVAAQELSQAAADAFNTQLADLYPYRILKPQTEPSLGNGVLSKYPLTDDTFWLNFRGNQRMIIAIPGRSIVFYNVHLADPVTSGGFDQHIDEVTQLLQRVKNETAPLIVAGDFNMTDFSEGYGQITQQFTDSYRSVGGGFGWTYSPLRRFVQLRRILPIILTPLTRIDYVFVDPHFMPATASVSSDSGGSDHYPTSVTLIVQPEATPAS